MSISIPPIIGFDLELSLTLACLNLNNFDLFANPHGHESFFRIGVDGKTQSVVFFAGAAFDLVDDLAFFPDVVDDYHCFAFFFVEGVDEVVPGGGGAQFAGR